MHTLRPSRREFLAATHSGAAGGCGQTRKTPHREYLTSVAHSHLVTYESEIRVMASRSCRPDGCEDGFDFWGYYTRAGRQFIYLTTVSGRDAVRTPTRYVQDLPFIKAIYRCLSENYGCACLGGGHDHHRLGLDGPSGVDIEQVMSISRRNGFRRWCEIITTAETTAGPGAWFSHHSRASIPRIRLNAFSYLDPQQGEYVRTQLLVLPGISPLRLALAHRREIPAEALGEEGLYFPLSHIVYDECADTDSGDVTSEEGIEELSRQCRELPEDLQPSLGIEAGEETITVSVTLPSEHVLTVRYARASAMAIENVALHCRNQEAAYDLTPQLTGRGARRSLKRICRYALAWIERCHGVQQGNRYRRRRHAPTNINGFKSACNVPESKEITDACDTDRTGP